MVSTPLIFLFLKFLLCRFCSDLPSYFYPQDLECIYLFLVITAAHTQAPLLVFLLWSWCFFFFPLICAAGRKEGREMELVFIFLFLCVIIFLFLHSNNFECSLVLNFHIRVIISYCWEGDFRKLLCIDCGLKLPGLYYNPL